MSAFKRYLYHIQGKSKNEHKLTKVGISGEKKKNLFFKLGCKGSDKNQQYSSCLLILSCC